MVFGGVALLGTCVGFKGLLAARAGGSGGRRVSRARSSSRDQSRGPRRGSTRSVALRRPALAVGHGFVARGRPPRRF